MMSKPIYEIAIVGRATWDLHSLNNEGSIGNVSEPRTVMLADGTKCDGVSGEMLKHVHVASLWQVGQGDLPLCDHCRRLEPNKANKEPHLAGLKVGEAMQTAVQQCAICDLHGFLVESPTMNRSSCLEFGWAVALPEHSHRDLHLHARHAVGEKDKETDDTSQMVYHRPTRSGIYAVVSVFMPWRIGLEHLNYTYVVDPPARLARYRHALRAYQAMFWRTEGAMTTTRLPHLQGFEGAVVSSTTNLPVPLVSALADDYVPQLTGLAETIGEGLCVQQFSGMAQFVRILAGLADEGEPYALRQEG